MAQVTVLRASHLIDGTGADLIDDDAVVVVDGEITAVGSAGKLNLPIDTGVQTYEFIIPGR